MALTFVPFTSATTTSTSTSDSYVPGFTTSSLIIAIFGSVLLFGALLLVWAACSGRSDRKKHDRLSSSQRHPRNQESDWDLELQILINGRGPAGSHVATSRRTGGNHRGGNRSTGTPHRAVPGAALYTLFREVDGVSTARVDRDLTSLGRAAGHHEELRIGSVTTLPEYEVGVPPPAYLAT